MNLTDFTSTSGTLTTTESVPASVTTVASATGALSEGDVSLVLAPFLRDQLEVAAKAAVSACEAVNKAKRSDLSSEDGGFESCLISEALATAQPGGIMDAAAGYIESLNLDVSSSFKSPLDAAIAVAKSQARRKTFYVAFTFFSIYATKKAVMWQLRFPKAPKIPTKGWTAPSSTSSPTTCPPGAPTGSNMPVCEDEDCNGLDQKCSSFDKRWLRNANFFFLFGFFSTSGDYRRRGNRPMFSKAPERRPELVYERWVGLLSRQ
ncbi:MAG: hypothetical protein Q9157_000789 [Trypethelium eluteriae]